MAKRGPQVDTMFSKFWAKYSGHLNENMTPYYVMRWAFREGFQARYERDRSVARKGRR